MEQSIKSKHLGLHNVNPISKIIYSIITFFFINGGINMNKLVIISLIVLRIVAVLGCAGILVYNDAASAFTTPARFE